MIKQFYGKAIVAIGLISMCYLAGCTENDRARVFGGSMTVEIPANQKLVNVSWKSSDLWYLTRPRRAGETAEVWIFQEKSSLGAVEGKVIFTEK